MLYKNIYGQDELYHYGVKGMKWGVRKKTLKKVKATVKKATATAKVTAKKASVKVKESATSAASAIKRGASATKNFLKKHGGTMVKVALAAAAVALIGAQIVQIMSGATLPSAAAAAHMVSQAVPSSAGAHTISTLQGMSNLGQLANNIALIPFKPW